MPIAYHMGHLPILQVMGRWHANTRTSGGFFNGLTAILPWQNAAASKY